MRTALVVLLMLLLAGCSYLPVGQTPAFDAEAMHWPDTVWVCEPSAHGYIENTRGERDVTTEQILNLKQQAAALYYEEIRSALQRQGKVTMPYSGEDRKSMHEVLWRAFQLKESPADISKQVAWEQWAGFRGTVMVSRVQVVRKQRILPKGGTDTRTTTNFQYLLLQPARREVLRYRATTCPFCGSFGGGLRKTRVHRHVLKVLP